MSKNLSKHPVCLIFVPHEDDELNITGDFIYQAMKMSRQL